MENPARASRNTPCCTSSGSRGRGDCQRMIITFARTPIVMSSISAAKPPWGAPSSGSRWGRNQGKTIAPFATALILAFETSFLIVDQTKGIHAGSLSSNTPGDLNVIARRVIRRADAVCWTFPGAASDTARFSVALPRRRFLNWKVIPAPDADSGDGHSPGYRFRPDTARNALSHRLHRKLRPCLRCRRCAVSPPPHAGAARVSRRSSR